MTRVMITGAGGFIGSHLVEDQLARGREVVAVDLEEGHLACLPKSDRLRFVKCDITDTATLAPFLAGTEIVFHLAAIHLEVGVPESQFYAVNVRAVTDFLAAARSTGVKRFVHCSSVGIYGNVEGGAADESGPFRPTNPYEKTKLAGEREALRFHSEAGFPVTVLRPAWVFGPRCPRTGKLLRAIGRGRFLMIGPCRNLRHPVYIADMVQAFNLAAEKPEAIGEVFVIAGERPVTIDEFVRTFAEVTGGPYPRVRIPLWLGYVLGGSFEIVFGLLGIHPPMSRRTLTFFTNNNAFNIAKARRVLGFSPKYDLKSGLQQTLIASVPKPDR